MDDGDGYMDMVEVVWVVGVKEGKATKVDGRWAPEREEGSHCQCRTTASSITKYIDLEQLRLRSAPCGVSPPNNGGLFQRSRDKDCLHWCFGNCRNLSTGLS